MMFRRTLASWASPLASISLEPVASHTFPFTFPAAGVAMPEIFSVLLSMVDLHKMGESSGCFIAS
jgi:hypothetical protein